MFAEVLTTPVYACINGKFWNFQPLRRNGGGGDISYTDKQQ